jgi:hypothetical protein
MNDAERDPIVRRAIEELRRAPRADHTAVSRVVAAAAAARVAPADDEVMVEPNRGRHARRWTVVGIAAAAAFAGFALSSMRWKTSETAAVASVSGIPAQSALELQAVSSTSADALPIMKQFVFSSRTARRVSVVGDFNRWNPSASPMVHAPDGDLWSVSVPVLPGRHMYAFMVDDSMFVLDPREPTARDADLGVEASVTIVGKP